MFFYIVNFRGFVKWDIYRLLIDVVKVSKVIIKFCLIVCNYDFLIFVIYVIVYYCVIVYWLKDYFVYIICFYS